MGWLGEGFGGRGGGVGVRRVGWAGGSWGEDEVAARGLCMMNWIEEDLSTEEKQHIRIDR